MYRIHDVFIERIRIHFPSPFIVLSINQIPVEFPFLGEEFQITENHFLSMENKHELPLPMNELHLPPFVISIDTFHDS